MVKSKKSTKSLHPSGQPKGGRGRRAWVRAAQVKKSKHKKMDFLKLNKIRREIMLFKVHTIQELLILFCHPIVIQYNP